MWPDPQWQKKKSWSVQCVGIYYKLSAEETVEGVLLTYAEGFMLAAYPVVVSLGVFL